MEIPSYDECLAVIRQKGRDAAATILVANSIPFEAASSEEDARRIIKRAANIVDGAGVEVAGAYLLQARDCIDDSVVKPYCTLLNECGLVHFYDRHDSRNGLQVFQVSAALDPSNEEAVCGVISVCVHGQPLLPKVALPYMVVLAQINPKRDEVAYVLRLIAAESGSG